jgi:hypothetical protein
VTLPAATADAEGYVRCGNCGKRLTITVASGMTFGKPALFLAMRYWTTTTRPMVLDDDLRVWRHEPRVRRIRALEDPPRDVVAGWLPHLPAIIVCDNLTCRRRSILLAEALDVYAMERFAGNRVCGEHGCGRVGVRPPAVYCAEHGGIERAQQRALPGQAYELGKRDVARLAALR